MPHFKPVSVAALVLSVLALSTSPVHGLGLGRPSSQAVLGDTLQVTVPLRVEPGESVTEDCVSAEVFFGDDRVAPAAVSVALSPSRDGSGQQLMVRTTALINEPVVTVRLSAGCHARITRQFVALADPPGREPWPSPDVTPPAVSTPFAEAAAQASPPVARPARRAERRTARSTSASTPPKPVARLQLDPVDADAVVQPDLRWTVEMSPQALAAAQAEADPQVQARREAAAALWRALNATPQQMLADRQHIQTLEQRLQRLQQVSDGTRATVAGLQAKVREIESRGQDAGSGAWPWALALTGAGGLAYAWGRRAGRRELPSASAQVSDRWWQQDSNEASDEPPQAASIDDVHLDPVAGSIAVGAPDAAEAVAAEPGRAVSVEELIDLEQQAEFFVVLGQDEAAIELLEGHVFGDAVAIPWPHLKLLEIHQRLGQRAEYERVQAEFNRHFKAQAPAWESDLERGRHLVDHPAVIERLQALWPEPDRAMGLLETSLLHQQPGGETFELPAYRELLFLYGVARDLADRADVVHGDEPILPVEHHRP